MVDGEWWMVEELEEIKDCLSKTAMIIGEDWYKSSSAKF
jgi:hypothetical protein